MFVALDALMAAELPQMKLHCEIDRLDSNRPEKGAAVAAAEYLQCHYPETSGFSPRNVHRMRDFYRLHKSVPQLMEQTLHMNWTQNVVIMGAGLSAEERMWYLQVCTDYSWTKTKLQRQIDCNAHLKVSLDQIPPICYNNCESKQETRVSQNYERTFYLSRQYMQKSDGAGLIVKNMVKKAGLKKDIPIAFAATSAEKIGRPVYPPARHKLAEHGIRCDGHSARQLINQDCDEYDLLIGMD